MKICYINLDYPPNLGGISAIAYSLVQAISKNSFVEKIKVVSFRNKKPREARDGKIELIAYKAKSPRKIAIGTFKSIWKNRDCSVFHSTDFFPIALYMLIFAKLFLRKKLFVSVFGTDSLSLEGSKKTRFFKRLILKYCDAVFMVSESTSNLVKKFYNLKGDNFVVTYAGLNKKILSNEPKNIRNKLGINENDFVVITVCRLIKRKGVDDLIKAIKKIDDKDVKLLIIGDGPEAENLKNLSHELNIEDKIIFAGAIQNPSDYYYSSDVFSMPSKYLKSEGDIEGLGIVYIEAQYFGLPVIGTNSGGIPEAIDQGKSGFVIDEGDVAGLAEKILYLKNKINEENIALQFGKIDENWMENKATWTAATDSTDWNSPGDFFSEITPPNWTIIDDSIEVTLPTDLLQNWLESDSTNFGLVIYSSADNSFLEINSSETENAPRLIFDYKKTADDSIQTYSAAPVSDTFIYSTDNNFTKFENQLIVANIQPTKMFIKFNLSDTIFINMENSGIGNSDDFRRMTINRAELVFHKLDENYYLAGDELTLRPYPVLTANPSIPFTYGDDYEYLTGSSADSLNNDEISVDVTEIVQKITSGDYENNGLLLKSTFENKDFSHIEFAPKDYNDEAWRPYLKIIYTPPYLDE